MGREKEKFGLNMKIEGVPWKMFLLFAAIVLTAMATGGLGTDMISIMAMLFVIGGICYFVGERIPIFNTWIGGGSMMAMMLPSFLVYRGIITEKYVEGVTLFFDTAGYQTMFICILMACAFVVIDRETLLQSIVRYIPTILAGVLGAAIAGCLVGMALGYSIPELLTYYVLPIMGGGNGAGAIPMSQIYEAATGKDKDAYYAAAVAILTIANILCIIMGAILNGIGNKIPSLTGDKKEIMRNGRKAEKDRMTKLPEPSLEHTAVGFLIIGIVYILSVFMAKVALPKIGSVQIHQYVYFVLFFILINVSGILPKEYCAGIKRIQAFLVGRFSVAAFAAVGISLLNFSEFVSAINIQTLIVCLGVVAGAVIGSAGAGYLLGFYPIDAAITAGLCMANRGGGGDVVVLGAADRLDLMSYAAISSRIGGGLVLLIAGIVFSLVL